MRSNRAGIAACAALLLALLLGGCVVFKGPVQVKQIGDKPRVAVTFKLCNSDGKDHADPRCPNLGNSNDDGASDETNVGEAVLLGFRVPRGTKIPKGIRSTTQGAGTLRPLELYTDALNELAPTPDGFRWFGYWASGFGQDGGHDSARRDVARIRTTMRVPERLVGKKFAVRPVVGWYDDHDVKDGLDCGPDPFEFYGDGAEAFTICIDSPSRRQTRKSIKIKIE